MKDLFSEPVKVEEKQPEKKKQKFKAAPKQVQNHLVKILKIKKPLPTENKERLLLLKKKLQLKP